MTNNETLVKSGNEFGDIVADRIVALLNEILELDRQATEQLIFGPYILCNEALADHPSIQVRSLDEKDVVGERKWGVRMMGLLNGLAGSYHPDGWGVLPACLRWFVKNMVKLRGSKLLEILVRNVVSL